jgi:hypothetical protein
MKRLAGSLLIAAAIAVAPSANAETKVYVDGIGTMKCSAILVGMKNEPAKAANAILGWTYGYMARRNVERGSAGQSQVEYAEVDPEKVLGTITGFCGENPDVRLFQIVDSLYGIMLEESAKTS